MEELFDSNNTPPPECLRKLLGPEVKSFVMLCHSSPPSFYTAPLHLALHLQDPFGLVGELRPGSGVCPHRRLSTTGNGRVCFFIYDPFGLHEVGNHGPDAESDSAAGYVCACTLNATWLEFSIFPLTTFYPTFQKFSTTSQKFSFSLVI